MTREEAIKELENMKKFNYTLAPLEVFDMAITALKQEPKTKGSYRPVISGNFQNPPKVKSAETEDTWNTKSDL